MFSICHLSNSILLYQLIKFLSFPCCYKTQTAVECPPTLGITSYFSPHNWRAEPPSSKETPETRVFVRIYQITLSHLRGSHDKIVGEIFVVDQVFQPNSVFFHQVSEEVLVVLLLDLE